MRQNFLKIGMAILQRYPVGQNFVKITIKHNFPDISIFVFCNFCEKLENSKWPPFLERQFFETWQDYSVEIPCGSKISSKSLYLAQFLRYKHFCALHFLVKNSKIQNGRHFWQDKFFLKIGITTLQRYPAGQRFRRNRSI